MWKEETPVSRLIDELIGKKSLNLYLNLNEITMGRLCVPFYFIA